MAKGSEQFAWKQFPDDLERACFVCRRTLRIPDVARHETRITYRQNVGYAEYRLYCLEHMHTGYQKEAA